MTFDSTALALSPWGFWKTTETSGTTLADSSGNSRTLTITGSPTLNQSGPVSPRKAVAWTNTASQHAETSATTNATTFTHAVWVYLGATPAATIALQARAIAYNTAGAADGEFFVDSAGKLNFHVYNGANQVLTATGALTLNTWHLAVASVGAAGMKIRVDKVNAVSPNAGVTNGYGGASQLILVRGGGTGYTGTAAVTMGDHLYFTSQLSDPDADSLYDSMMAAAAAGSLSFSGSAGATVAASAAGSLTFGGSVSPAPTTGAGSLSLSGTVGAAGQVSAAGSLSFSGAVAVVASAAAAGFLTFGATAVAQPLYTTDTSNTFGGLSIVMTAEVFVTQAVVAPIGTATTRVDKAIALPLPTLVKGRPT